MSCRRRGFVVDTLLFCMEMDDYREMEHCIEMEHCMEMKMYMYPGQDVTAVHECVLGNGLTVCLKQTDFLEVSMCAR